MSSKKADIIIVGAGLGGLVSAALLAKEGLRVIVLEKNKQTGGCLQSFGLEKKLVESAVHYMGSLSEGQTLYKVFDYLGIMSSLKLKKMDEACFDEIRINDVSYKLAQGYNRFIDTLAIQFPHQRAALEKYIEEIKNTCAHFPLYNMRMGRMEEKKDVIGFSLQEKLDAIFEDETLKKVLCGNNLLYAGTETKTPFYLHALIQNSYIESSWKFAEGSAQLAKLLQDVIHSHGGKVLRNEEVIEFKVTDHEIEYVNTTNGTKFRATNYISNLHPAITYSIMDTPLIRQVTRKRIDATPSTKSCFMVNISLKEKMIPYTNHNIYYHKTDNVWSDIEHHVAASPNTYSYFFYQDKLNPLFSSAVSILCFIDFENFAAWEKSVHTTTYIKSRGADYAAYKQLIIEKYIQESEHVLPGLANAISTVDACTPLTYRDYLNTPKGGLYGVRKDVDDAANTTYATRTKVNNLFLTGQNINLHGVLGVSITALITAGDIVGLEHLVHKINTLKS